MSAQEFKPGDTVRFTDLNRAVGSPFWPGAVYTVHYVRQDGLVSIRGIDKPALAKHFEKVEHAEPEDKADLHVEPEPLKEGAEPAFHDDDVHHLKVISGSTTIFDGLAVFEEADSGNITVTPVPRCTSLFEKAGSILRCGQHEGHSDGHWTVGSTPAAAWSDERAYGRVIEGGAS